MQLLAAQCGEAFRLILQGFVQRAETLACVQNYAPH